jgi:Major Facilitator Superfamily
MFDAIGWRGLLWLGILPAFLCVYIRYFVKEPDVWVENRKRQLEENREIRIPLLALFKPALLGNTLSACWWMAGTLVAFYAVFGLFATWLQTEFELPAAAVATPVLLANVVGIIPFWGWVADRYGRRRSIIIQAMIGCAVAPAYLLSKDLSWIIAGFIIQGAFFGGVLPTLAPCYLTELPDRGTGHGKRVLLSLRRGHWRIRDASIVVLRGRATHGLCGADADRHIGRLRERYPCIAGQPGDQRESIRCRIDGGLTHPASGAHRQTAKHVRSDHSFLRERPLMGG